MVDLVTALAAFDGRDPAPLRALIAEEPEVRRVLEHVPGPHEVAATWVLKALAERGRLSTAEIAGFLGRLPLLRDPDALLHLLQSVQYALPPVARALRDDMVPLYGHPRGLVRVWAFDAYVRGADLPAEMADITERLRQGLEARDAAMRARSRGLAQELGIALG